MRAGEKAKARFLCLLVCPGNIFLKRDKEVLEFPIKRVYDKSKVIHLLIYMGWTGNSYCDP